MLVHDVPGVGTSYSDIGMYSNRMIDPVARATLFHGLSDPVRLTLLEELSNGPRNVSDLVVVAGLKQPSVSKHLSCLWDCGLVERERQGREVHYRLTAEIEQLIGAADRLLDVNGDRVRSCPRYGRAAMLGEAA